MTLPVIAVVGRPNVGKSTFVNRLMQTQDAIVHAASGVTRDRSYHKADWNGVEFMLIDTGGIEFSSEDAFGDSIRKQAVMAAEEADVIILLVDGQTGITPGDEEVARLLKRVSKPGRRIYVNKSEIPWVLSGMGISILTTPQGIMTGQQARRLGIGGEVLCYVW